MAFRLEEGQALTGRHAEWPPEVFGARLLPLPRQARPPSAPGLLDGVSPPRRKQWYAGPLDAEVKGGVQPLHPSRPDAVGGGTGEAALT